ncbi:MAG: hypothetical protein JXD23_12490 [Spirochaetales bacterium]|nr:hypothetical protein [Spirochaetales bacterium]
MQKAKEAKLASGAASAAVRHQGEFIILRICRVLYLIGVFFLTIFLFFGIIATLFTSGLEGLFNNIGNLLTGALTIILLLGSYGTITLLHSDHRLIAQIMDSIRNIRKNIKG